MPKDLRLPVTMADVARRCGVSKATVSKALNPHPHKSDINLTTRERIRTIAAGMGYRPERHDGGSHLTIALVYATFDRAPYLSGVYEHLAENMCEALDAAGHHFLMVPLRSAAAWRSEARQRQLDACVVMQPMHDGFDRQLVDEHWRCALLNQSSTEAIDQVLADDAGGTRQLCEHLHGLGHRDLVFLQGDYNPHPCFVERRTAFEIFLASSGCRGSITSDTATALNLVRDGSTAVIGEDSKQAFAVLTALGQAGLRVPDEVSVASADDVDAHALTWPTITAVEIPMRAMAHEAVRLVSEERSNRDRSQRRIVLPERLVVRASTAAPHRPRRSEPRR